MLDIKKQILQYLSDRDDGQYHDVSHITKASAIKDDPGQLKQIIAQLDNDKMIELRNSTDNRYMGYYNDNITNYTIYCKIKDTGKAHIISMAQNFYSSELAKMQFIDYPETKRIAKEGVVTAKKAIKISILIGLITFLLIFGLELLKQYKIWPFCYSN
jgi:hypothetical protein